MHNKRLIFSHFRERKKEKKKMDFQLQDFNLDSIQITEILNTTNQDSVFCSSKHASNSKSCEWVGSFMYDIDIYEEMLERQKHRHFPKHFGNFRRNLYNTYV